MVRRWRNVRVFISSTFRDTHFERDALTRLIFPELRQWCEERYLHVTEVDLRWGVTQEESAAGKAIEICLDEIDRSDIFLCLIGSRYGWVPDKYEVGTESRFMWIKEQSGLSITELEIMRGALNSQDTLAENVSHALFYFRDEEFLKDLEASPKSLCEFTDGHTEYRSGELIYIPNEEKQAKLLALKQRIQEEAKKSTNNIKTFIHEKYPSLYHTDERLSQTNEATLRKFCDMVLTDLKRAIDERYPMRLMHDESNVEEAALENTYHQAYMDFRLSQFLPRDQIVHQVVDFARREVVLDKMPLLVYGESGVGKSSVLAKVCEILDLEQQQNESSARGSALQLVSDPSISPNTVASDRPSPQSVSLAEQQRPLRKGAMKGQPKAKPQVLIRYFAGASPGSRHIHNMLRTLVQELRRCVRKYRPKNRVDQLWTLIRTSLFVGQHINLNGKLKEKETVSSLRRAGKRYHYKVVNDIPSSYSQLVEEFKRLLLDACKYTRLVLVLDNLDHLVRDKNHALTLSWLPHELPKNLRLVIGVESDELKLFEADSPIVVPPRSPDLPLPKRPLSPQLPSKKNNRKRRLSKSSGRGRRRGRSADREPTSPFSDSGIDYRPQALSSDNGSAGTFFPELSQFEQFEQRSFLESFQLHFRQHLKLHVPRLTQIEARELIIARLGQYGKKLSDWQMKSLLDKASSGNPTWIVIACEELRIFNVYEKVNNRILDLAEDLQSLLDQMISRLEQDHGPRFVRDALSIILCSRDGLFEHEIMGILGVPLSSWSQLYYSIKPLLTNHTRAGDELISFSHHNFTLAILKRYFAGSPEMTPEEVSLLPMRSPHAIPIHARLSKFFRETAFDSNNTYNSENGRALSCLPYHLLHGRLFRTLEATLTDLEFVEALLTADAGFSWIDDLASSCVAFELNLALQNQDHTAHGLRLDLEGPLGASLGLLSSNQVVSSQPLESVITEDMILRVRDYYAFAQRYTPELSGNPSLVFQYAANLPDMNAASIAAQKLWASDRSHRPWLRWVNKIQEQGPCLLTLSGHTAPVLWVDISQDGKRVVSASEDCTIRVWITATGESDFVLAGHKDAVTCAVISPDSSDVIVSTSRDGTACVWIKGVCALTFDRHGRTPVLCCCISDCGRFVCTGDQAGALKIWEIFSDGECLHEFHFFPSAITMCRFSADNEYIFCAGADNTIRAWRFEDGSQYMCKSGEAMCFAPNCAGPDQKVVYCLRNSSMKLRIFDAEYVNHSLAQPSQIKAGKLRPPSHGSTIARPSRVVFREGTSLSLAERRGISGTLQVSRSQTFLQTSSSIITSSSFQPQIHQSTLHSFSEEAKQEHSEDKDQTSEQAEVSEGGKLKISQHRSKVMSAPSLGDTKPELEDQVLRPLSRDSLLSLDVDEPVLRKSEVPRVTLKDEDAHLATKCAISSTRRMAVAREDGNVSIFNTDTGEKIAILHGHIGRVNNCVYDASGRTLVTASNDCTVKIWNPRRARLAANTPHKAKVLRTSFAKNNCLLSVSQEGCVCIWNAPTGVKTTMKPHGNSDKDFVRDAGFAKNGEYYLTVSNVVRVATSKANEEQRTWTLPQPNTALWDISPCGRIVLCVEAGSKDFHVWSLYSNPPKLLRTVTGAHERKLTVCQFSADGALVYTGGNDGKVKIWNAVALSAEKYSGAQFTTRLDLNQGEIIRPLHTLQDEKDLGLASLIHSICESPDGKKLLAISDSPDIKVLHLEAALENFQTQYVTSLHAHDNRVTCAAWSRHPFMFASASVNGAIKIWNSKNFECTLEIAGHTSSILDVKFLPDGQRLASISSDKSLAIWNVTTGEQVNCMSFPSHPCQLSISVEGRYLAVGTTNGDLRILELMSETIEFPMVTARRYCNLTIKGKAWESRPKIDCVFCGHRFAINNNLDSMLSTENTSDAIQDLKFILRCISCRHVLRSNPVKLDRKDCLMRNFFRQSRRKLNALHHGTETQRYLARVQSDEFYSSNLTVMTPFRRKRKVPKLTTSSKKTGIEQEADLMARHVHELKLRTQAKQYKTFHMRKPKLGELRSPVVFMDPMRSPRNNGPAIRGGADEDDEVDHLAAIHSIDAEYLLREGCTLRRCHTASSALQSKSVLPDQSLAKAVDFRSASHMFSVMHGGLPEPAIPTETVNSLCSLALFPNKLDFGLVSERSNCTRSLQVTNKGHNTVRIKVLAECASGEVTLTVLKAPNKLIPGLNGSLVLQMSTTVPGVAVEGTVRILTSAGDAYTLPIHATVASKADAAVFKAQRVHAPDNVSPLSPQTPTQKSSLPKIPNVISSPTSGVIPKRPNRSFFDDRNPLSPDT